FIADEADEVTDTSFVSSKTAEEWVQKASIVKPYIVPGRGKRIVLIDLGMSQSILHEQTEKGCHITVVPYDYSNEDVQAYKQDGMLLSNVPGYPDKAVKTICTVQTLLVKYLIFVIGLSHHIIALAYGSKTKNLHIVNYGVSFPVKEFQTDRTWITTQSRS